MTRAPLGWLIAITVFASASAAPAQAPSGEEIMRRAHLAMYYAGTDMRTRVTMRLVSREGSERVRELTMARRTLREGGEQRYFLFFHRPPDVREMAFLVWKYPGRDDDRWLYVPALKLVRRIAASDKHTSFVGSDFSYEDISGREPEEDSHRLVREETVGGRDAHVVESIPRDPGGAEFSRKLSWIETATGLPLREEYYDQRGDLARVFTADEVKAVQGFWTVTRRTMTNVQSGHRTEVTLSDTRYDLKLAPDLFTERALRAPPADLVR